MVWLIFRGTFSRQAIQEYREAVASMRFKRENGELGLIESQQLLLQINAAIDEGQKLLDRIDTSSRNKTLAGSKTDTGPDLTGPVPV